MADYTYQRFVIAYHGCHKDTADAVLLKGETLRQSEKDYDWLGKGIYFWEHGPDRALEWARQRFNQPAVVGALINLGRCFDLLDTRYTNTLSDAWPYFCATVLCEAKIIPENQAPPKLPHSERVLHYRDCAVMNWVIPQLEQTNDVSFDTVRGVFIEGKPVYEGSSIHMQSHIQLAIRNPACIIGYFRPIFHHE